MSTHDRLRAAILTLALACAAAGCIYGDPGYSAAVENRSDRAVIIRNPLKVFLEAHASGYLIRTLGEPSSADPIDYEFVDAATCAPLGSVHVNFGVHPSALITVAADRALSLGPNAAPDPDIADMLPPTEECPGPRDGWWLWVRNDTADTFYVRSRSQTSLEVALITPHTTAGAVGGFAYETTIELLDTNCRVLNSSTRTGWGPFEGVVHRNELTVEPADFGTGPAISFSFSQRCRVILPDPTAT